MYSKQQKLMAFMAGILLLLVAVIVFVEPPEEEDSTSQPLFPDLDRDDIQHIEVFRGDSGGRLVLDKVDGDWQISAPLKARADESRVGDLLFRISNFKVSETIETDDPGPFGLGSSSGPPVGQGEAALRKIIFSSADGQRQEIFVGNEAPVGYGTYVMIGAEAPVQVVEGHFSSDFTKPVEDYRSHDVWQFSVAKVDRLEWSASFRSCPPEDEGAHGETTGESRRGFIHKDEHGWWLGEGRRRLDSNKVETLLRRAKDLRINSFQAPALTDEQLLQAQVTIVAGGAQHHLSFGCSQGGQLVGLAPLSERPVVLEATASDFANPDLDALFLEKLLPVRRFSLTELVLKLGDLEFEGSRDEDGWADERADELLDVLEQESLDRSAINGSWSGQPWGRIQLLEGDSRKESLLLAPPEEDGSCLASDEAGGPLFRVPGVILDALRAALANDAQEAESVDR